jgi:phage gp29-like protein
VPATGAVGTQIFSGIISGVEFNPELTDDGAIEIFDKMTRTDAQIQSTMLAATLPIRAALWDVEPGDDSSQALTIRDEVYKQLFDNENFTWDDFLRQTLYYLTYGYYVFEKVRAVKDGKYQIVNLSPRLPKTIRGWYQNEEGILKEVEQFALFPDGKYRTVRIPNDSLLLFTHDREGNNFRGKSMLRTIYRNYLAKDLGIRLDLIQSERHAVGVPKISLPQSVKDGDEEAAETVGEAWRAHENQYVDVPHGYGFEIVDMKTGATKNILDSVKYHDTEISSNILAQFLDLGKTETGARSVGETHSNTFHHALESIAKYIMSVCNDSHEKRRLIREIVDYNFGPQEKYPYLKCTKISTVDYDKLATTLKTLKDASMLTPQYSLESWLRQELNLPELPEDSWKEPAPPPDPLASMFGKLQPGQPPKPGEKVVDDPAKKPGEEADEEGKIEEREHIGHVHLKSPDEVGIGYWRPLTEIEKAIGLKEMDIRLRAFFEVAFETGDKFRGEMVKALVDEGLKLLSSKKPIGEFMRGIVEVKIPGKAKMASAMAGVLKDVYRYGRERVADEIQSTTIKQMGPVPKKRKKPLTPIFEDPEEMAGLSQALSETTVSAVSNKLHTEWRRELISQRKTGVVNTKSLTDTLLALSKNDFKSEMRQAVNQIFGLGRAEEATRRREDIQNVIRSEVMDDKTCGPCEGVDGAEFKPTDPAFDAFAAGPYVDCEGGDSCRGINIYVGKGDE